MCYSKEVSIATYTIGTISSILLYNRKNPSLKINGLFFLFVTQMQLIDYLIWKNNECNKFNTDISHIGAILNHMQPIILYILVKHFNKNLKDNQKNILDMIIIIYLLSLLNYNKNIYPLECTEVKEDSKPYLKWGWNYKPNNTIFYVLFIAILSLLQLFGLEKPYNIFISIILLLSLIGSRVITGKRKYLGAMWCWFSALLPAILLLFDMYLENKN
jgi:hypothetical protein